jgi:hypothetical protein
MRLTIQPPPSHRRRHLLQGICAYARQETGEYPARVADGLSRPKREAKKCEVYMRVRLSAIAVLSIDDLRLLRVHHQSAF